MRWAILLAGGSGTRFWPLSTPHRPKQVLPLGGERSLALDAVDRIAGLVPRERLLLVTGKNVAPALQEQLALDSKNVLIEPIARSTGPALLWATFEAARRDPDAVMLSTHGDWHVPKPADFAIAADQALTAAESTSRLITVGVVPSRPDPGYGYIVPKTGPAGAPVREVETFIEKPAVARAEQLIKGGALWNSGLFAWRASVFLEEARAVAPELARALHHLEANRVDRFFEEVSDISVDVAVLERSRRVSVVRGEFAWDDIGTWEALARVRPADVDDNVLIGPAQSVDSTANIVWAEATPVVLAGVSGLVVVHANGRILVMDRSRAASLKTILERLPPEVKDL